MAAGIEELGRMDGVGRYEPEMAMIVGYREVCYWWLNASPVHMPNRSF
jgi:hypothetical protein